MWREATLPERVQKRLRCSIERVRHHLVPSWRQVRIPCPIQILRGEFTESIEQIDESYPLFRAKLLQHSLIVLSRCRIEKLFDRRDGHKEQGRVVGAREQSHAP